MKKYVITYLGATVAMILMDALWLGFIARPFYLQGIGHLMADTPRIGVAALFYLLYPVGLLLFAIAPQEEANSGRKTALWAALFGLFAYGTYDLTNLATLKDWPASVALIDMAWGAMVSAVSALAGKAAMDAMRG